MPGHDEIAGNAHHDRNIWVDLFHGLNRCFSMGHDQSDFGIDQFPSKRGKAVEFSIGVTISIVIFFPSS